LQELAELLQALCVGCFGAIEIGRLTVDRCALPLQQIVQEILEASLDCDLLRVFLVVFKFFYILPHVEF
jgi:hypothetical protein